PNGPDVTFATGDVNKDGEIDVTDINLLSQAVRDGKTDAVYDINGDSDVSDSDRTAWVEEIQNTFFGDANLDGEFNSGDFVTVFAAGEYEDEIVGNSTWGTGDWNGDGDFNSGDFVTAFGAAGYEKGPRPAPAVPEPSGMLFTALGLLAIGLRNRTA
ncbi:dockerin type I domain-containing protein, partial [Planctomycetota bacterium]